MDVWACAVPQSPEGVRFLVTRVTDVYELPNWSAGI